MRLGVLTSGGDAPGMNAAIAGVCEQVERRGGQAWGIQHGFAGLAERHVARLTPAQAHAHAAEAGTWLGTSRWKALETPAGRDACFAALEALGLDGLVVIGGHGSALGARVLADALPVAFVPATIDHDVEGTGATLGMDSAIRFALETIGQLRVTGRSLPGRAFLVQTLGAPSGYLTDAVAHAAGIDLVLVPERPIDLDAIAAALADRAPAGQAIALMSEAVGDAVRISEDLAARADVRVHPTILGHAQRAARPSARDLALGHAAAGVAVGELAEGRSSFVHLAVDGTASASPLTSPPPPRTQGALA